MDELRQRVERVEQEVGIDAGSQRKQPGLEGRLARFLLLDCERVAASTLAVSTGASAGTISLSYPDFSDTTVPDLGAHVGMCMPPGGQLRYAGTVQDHDPGDHRSRGLLQYLDGLINGWMMDGALRNGQDVVTGSTIESKDATVSLRPRSTRRRS